jgi:hypothetical protein
VLAPLDGRNVPGAQPVHVLWPLAATKAPAAEQLTHEVWPGDGWNVPAAQLVHELWPGESVNVPGLQPGQVLWPLDAWKLPGLQAVQGSEPVMLELPGAQSCAVAGVTIAPVRLRTTSAANARSGDRRAIDFPFPSVRETPATRLPTRRDAGAVIRGRGQPPESSHADAYSWRSCDQPTRR